MGIRWCSTVRPAPRFGRRSLSRPGLTLLIITLIFAIWGCQSVQDVANIRSNAAATGSRGGDELMVVDCLLPGQIRKLGRSLVYLTPQRPIKTSAQDCEIRGGDYVAYDRGDYATALKVWLPLAKEGDTAAQTYVGEIYEKGLGVPPDYALAAEWYRRAAEQGFERAQINLGHLYEKGFGVERDPLMALYWYRQASGLSQAIAIDPGGLNNQTRQEVEQLRQEVERRKREAELYQQRLAQTQQQLGVARQELARRSNEAEAEVKTLDQARQELERQKQEVAARDSVALKTLEEQLRQREADLERHRQEVARLQQEVGKLEADAARRQQQIAMLNEQQVALAAPTIEIIDPPLRSRGSTQQVATRSGVERLVVGKVQAPAGLLTLAINDRQEIVDDNGLFRVAMHVQRSAVPVNIVAIDKQGARSAIEFLLTPEEQPNASTTPSSSRPVVQPKPRLPNIPFGNYHALLIGNKDYQYWPRLDTPENDARITGDLLSRKYGFKSKVILNATRYDILKVLNDLRKELTEKDNLLIYYAGHGHLDEKISRGYWIPTDGEVDSNANWISTLAITDILNSIPAKHILVVADTCYAGALTRSALARLEAGMSDEARYNWLKIMAEKRSRTVLTSGDLKPVLDSGGGKHSIFAKALIDLLQENADIIEGQRLYQQISARVAYAAAAVMTDAGAVEQVPQYAPIKYAGHESGDFLFVPLSQ
jgi:Caspase domain/Sel1 repeat